MYLGIRYRCNCGCTSEFNSDTTAAEITCPNCGVALPPDVSEKLLSMLHNAKEIPEEFSEALFPKLTFITSPYKLWKTQSETS